MKGIKYMEIAFIIIGILILYIVIQVAIDHSINTKLMRENYKVLVEIRELLKKQNKDL